MTDVETHGENKALARVPDEVWSHVFGYCLTQNGRRPKSRMVNLLLVCKAWKVRARVMFDTELSLMWRIGSGVASYAQVYALS
jgi:hypothetical protein